MSKIMAVNAGSSSLKFQLLEMPEEKVITEGLVEKIGLEKPNFVIKYEGKKEEKLVDAKNHAMAVDILLKALIEKGIVKDLKEIAGVGHRILHCGEKYTDSVVMDDEAIRVVESVSDLGPLHNPANLTGIRAFKEALPGVVQVGVFDTSNPDSFFKEGVPDDIAIFSGFSTLIIPFSDIERYPVFRK